MPIPLLIGDRVRLSGGYDFKPLWLNGHAYFGIVSDFIPGRNDNPAAVVKLDAPISVDDVTGQIQVLELRYVGAEWTERNFVHVELCDFVPEAKPSRSRRHGKWVESHATCEWIDPNAAFSL